MTITPDDIHIMHKSDVDVWSDEAEYESEEK